MIRTTKENSMRWIPLGLLVFFLVLSSFVMGLSTDDDSDYLSTSQYVHLGHFLHYQDWSPLYIWWFKVLRAVCPNPIACFFLSWGLLVVLLTMIPTFCRIRSAWIYALVLLGFPFLTITPFVSLFGAAILLLGTCVVLQRERPIAEVAVIFCTFAFITSFARPEFDYGVYISAAVALAALLVEWLRLRPKMEPAAHSPRARAIVLGSTVILLAVGLFLITKHSRLPRSGVAFAQHYNRRAAEHGIIRGYDSWKSDYSQRRFGIDLQANANNTTATIFDFFRANPRHFLGHIRENLRDPRALELIFVFALFVLWPWVRRDARHLRYASVFVLLVGIPCVAASVMIYPRSHYALVLVPSLTIYALQLFDAARWLPWRPLTVLSAGCALIWLTSVGLPARAELPDTTDQVYLQRVQCVRQIDRTAVAALPVFESVPMLDVYFIHHRNIVSTDALAQWADFKAAAAQQHPAWISVDEGLAQRYRITTKELDDTLRGDLGYTPHPCPFEAHLTVYTNDTP